jgi:Flp pilus assembly protein CpaB
VVARITKYRTKRRSSANNLIGTVAIGAGLFALAYMVGKQSAPAPVIEKQRSFVAEYNVVEIPVPERPVKEGTYVRDIPVRMEKFPQHQLPTGVVRDLELLQNSRALVDFPGGLPMLHTNLGTEADGTNPVVDRIPPGMRAMTVRVDATSSVEGWARSGSIVDVLLTEKDKTTVVAELVKILSSERSTSAFDVEHNKTVPSTVTLLVTQEQCLAINTAIPLGRISLVLRSPKDEAIWRRKYLNASDLPSGEKVAPKSEVKGVISFSSGEGNKHFALVDGQWIPADDVPTGFLVGEREKGGEHEGKQ